MKQIHHQKMDLDQINDTENEPIKQNQNQNQNQNDLKKPLKLNNKRKSKNRAFGQDLTNKQREITNNNNNNKSNKINSNNDGFNFLKPTIKIKGEEQKTTIKRKLSMKMEQDVDDDNDSENDNDDDNDNNNNNDDDGESENDENDENEIISFLELAPWDMTDINNDLFVTDYVSNIMSSLRSDENSNRDGCIIENNIDFMTKQKDVNARMRTVLVDWLCEVHRKFKLLPSTYFLGINLLDRYLVKKQLHRRKLQLCGCTCLWIASKYHEIYAPEMDDFVYISDNAFNDEDLMSMEIEILKTLSFTLTVPTVLNYAERYTKISSFYLKKEREIKIISDLINYCIEHCVMTYDLCRELPSLIGAASFIYSCISTKVFSLQTFKNDNIDKVIGYSFDELVPIMKKIDYTVRNAKKSKHKAVYKKYCNQKYSNIGKLNFDKLNTSFLHKQSA